MNANGSKILCQIDSKTIKAALGIPESSVSEFDQFNEEEFTGFYRETNDEEKVQFIYKFLILGQSIDETPLPYHVKILQGPIQLVLSLLSQVLGFNDDKMVDEVMLSSVLKSSQSESYSKGLNFDELLVEKIHP